MRASPFLILAALWGVTANAAHLPLRPGTYVLSGSPCHAPPFAATFVYDGSHFSYPHASRCDSVIVAHSGAVFKVRETCAALGDGAQAKPDSSVTVYTIESPIKVRVSKGGGLDETLYRWCTGRQWRDPHGHPVAPPGSSSPSDGLLSLQRAGDAKRRPRS